MAIEPELLALMLDTVVIEPRTSLDAYLAPTYGTAVSVQARVERATRMVRNQQGDEVVSSTTTTLGVPLSVDPADRITLPDGSQPPILHVDASPDDRGAYNVIIYT